MRIAYRAPVESAHAEDGADFPFLVSTTSSDMARYQQSDDELLPLISHLEGQTDRVPRVFARGLSSYVMRNNVQEELRAQHRETPARRPIGLTIRNLGSMSRRPISRTPQSE